MNENEGEDQYQEDGRRKSINSRKFYKQVHFPIRH